FFSSANSHSLLAYSSTSACSNSSSPNTSSSSASTSNATTSKTQLSQCTASVHLFPQILNLMGPFFPVNKRLTFNQMMTYYKLGQQAAANSSGNSMNSNPKPAFNMFMPVMFVAHAHMNSAVVVFNSASPSTSSTNNKNNDNLLNE